MDSLRHAIDSLFGLLLQIGDVIVAEILTIELWLRGQLGQFGLAPAVQTTILVVFAIVLVVAALRLFGGLIRIAVLLFLLMIALHFLVPVMRL